MKFGSNVAKVITALNACVGLLLQDWLQSSYSG